MPTQRILAPVWGNLINRGPGLSNTNVNAAATWAAIGFLATESKTLNKVRIFLTKSGSPVAADYRLEIYDTSTTTGHPNSSLATATVPGADPPGGTFVEWTGLSLALSANTQYWLVLKNLNASPATHFFTVRYLNTIHGEHFGNTSGQHWASQNKATANSGGSWSHNARDVAGYRLEFADGTFAGMPLTDTTSTPQVYSSREWGALFTAPAADLVVAGVSMTIRKVGTPTGVPRYRIYQDINAGTRVLRGTTAAAQNGPWDTGTPGPWQALYFSAPVTIAAGLPTRVVLSETTQADASGNRFESKSYTVENDANSIALVGGFKGTLSTDGGTTFAETDTEVVPFALFLSDSVGGDGGITVPQSGGIPNLLRYRRGHLG